jgi:hypothetical protein
LLEALIFNCEELVSPVLLSVPELAVVPVAVFRTENDDAVEVIQ